MIQANSFSQGTEWRSELELLIKRTPGEGTVSWREEDIATHGKDETEDYFFAPTAVVFADSREEVSATLKFATEKKIPVTPRGGGTGLSGGALPVYGGIVLSLARMDRLLDLDEKNLFAVVEPGMITQKFQEAVEKKGLFYPPDPASRGSCTLGGNLAECAGGPRALKYGVTKDYIYGVEAVLPNGEVIQTGGKLLKNVTGFNLTQLLVGSEGTLAVITKLTIRLIALPQFKKTLMVPFPSIDSAAESVPAVFKRGIVPCAMEFMEKSVVQCAASLLGKEYPHLEAEAQILIELDGNDEEKLMRDAEVIAEVVSEVGALDVLVAENAEKQRELWDIRRACGEAVKKRATYKEEDTVVPRAALPELMRAIKSISNQYGITTFCYGHAGDGNIHVNILKENISDEKWNKELPLAITELFKETVRLGGTISGEHGIGYVQKEYVSIALSKENLRIQSKIKKAFDPDGILNPGKILPNQIFS